MNLSGLHRRLLAAVIDIGSPYPLVLAGGYAVQAHGLVSRVSQDLDVATENPAPMADIAAGLESGLTAHGWHVEIIGVDPLSARLMVTDPDDGERCEVDILKEHFWTPPTRTEYGPVIRSRPRSSLATNVIYTAMKTKALAWYHDEFSEVSGAGGRPIRDLKVTRPTSSRCR